jgi:hypothetical protein
MSRKTPPVEFVPFATPPVGKAASVPATSALRENKKRTRPLHSEDAVHDRDSIKEPREVTIDEEFEQMARESSASGEAFEATTRRAAAVSLPLPASSAKKLKTDSVQNAKSSSLPATTSSSSSSSSSSSHKSLTRSLSAPSLGDIIKGYSLEDAKKEMVRRFGCQKTEDVKVVVQGFTSESAFHSCRETTVSHALLAPENGVRWVLVAIWLSPAKKLAPWGFYPAGRVSELAYSLPPLLTAELKDLALDNNSTLEQLEEQWKLVQTHGLEPLIQKSACLLKPYKNI